ncbi:MAG: FAD-dependent oxidoreductase, partial [Dehalococcoidia bacterium]|nr:FAD-dependent oxidoreductase [Dehalococcoidia bacterium]
LVGCETAEYLAEKGKKVTITRRGAALATKMSPVLRAMQIDRLAAAGVRMLPGVKYQRATDKGLVVVDSQSKEELLEADTIVVAAGSQPNNALSRTMEGKAPQTHLIGDCVEARGILEAVADGARAGMAI